jgi:Zn-dependent peptidase ImmA (M78 family)
VAPDVKHLRGTLQRFGFSTPAIEAAWPGWWTDEAELSPSAVNELRFSLARKLGLDPRSMLEDGAPKFVWKEAKFKRLTTEDDFERSAITSFGMSIGRALALASTRGPPIEGMKAKTLRNSILANAPFVRLLDLLGLCWAIGVPVIHLRVFPLSAKRMCAMAVRSGDRHTILLGRDSKFPAPIAYYLAHEIGHLALGHLRGADSIVDLQDPLRQQDDIDDEERQADRFALELLTGSDVLTVDTETKRFGAIQLATNLLNTANSVRIEPGTLALCFGYSTKDWSKAQAAMRHIYATQQPVWAEVNNVANQQIDWSKISEDFSFFLQAVMGGISNDRRRS